jgi:antitoxin component of MazEF toxin-antitoxin module
MKRKIIRVGSSRGVLLPREVTRAMSWDFGTEVDLQVDRDYNEVILKTIKISLPEDFDSEQLRQIEEVMHQYDAVLGGVNE